MYLIGLLIFGGVCIGLIIWVMWTNKKDEDRYGGNGNEGFETNPNKEKK